LDKEKYTTPTPVQMQTIPIALLNYNLLVAAQTGSGKTASFILPIIKKVNKIMSQLPQEKENFPLALIIAPTRELCVQIEDQTKALVQGMKIRTGLFIGGFPIPNQIYRLSQGVQICIGTPGRLLALMNDMELELVSTLVIDEVDMMVQMGFDQQVEKITTQVQEKSMENVQKMFFSATITEKVETLSCSIMVNPVFILVGKAGSVNEAVKQTVIWVEKETDKKKKLFIILTDNKYYKPPLIVFVSSCKGAELLASAIHHVTGITTFHLHGEMNQTERNETLEAFRNGLAPIIVATDILARGIDLLNVTQVINFDMAASVEDYIHRIGRAGRLGTPGNSITFINNSNKSTLFVFFFQLSNLVDLIKKK